MEEERDMTAEHLYPVRVFWEDTDAGGVVYHSNYLKFMERARSEMIREAGISQTAMAEECGAVIVVAGLSIDYRRPARLEDELTVRTRLVSLRRASCELAQDIYRGDELLTTGRVRAACVNPETHRPVPFPEKLHAAMSSLLEQSAS